MKTFGTLSLALALSLGTAGAQSVNYALENRDGTGAVRALTLTELDGSPEATFQMWVKANELSPCTLLAQDNFAIEIDDKEQIVVRAGESRATMPAATLKNGWTQLTVVVDHGRVTAYMSGRRQLLVTGTLPETFAATACAAEARSVVIGRGLKGQIDEIRVWTRALDEDHFYWRNTLNKFNPNIDALAAYWKCDQAQCANLYDQTGRHHGDFDKGMQRVPVTDNAQFRYRVVTGYTDLMRFQDRAVIDRDMYLMTNDVVVLSGKVHADGSVFMQFPDNSMTGTNATYLAAHEGRTGLIDFGGEGAVMTAADAHCVNDPRGNTAYQASADVTVEGWVYIDRWIEGAELFSQYKDAANCLVLRLGSEADHALTVDVCGTEATLAGRLETGRWQYVAVYLKPAAGSPGQAGWSPVRIAIGNDEGGSFASQLYTADDGIEMSGRAMTITKFPALEDSRLTLGAGFDGKMDNVMVWGSDRSAHIATDATEPFRWNVGNWDNDFLNSYWTGDDPDNPGKDFQSYTHMVEIMRSYYAGHTGARIRFGLVNGSSEGWLNVLGSKANADRFIADCKRLVNECDGLDVDLEWMYNQNQWNIYNNIVRRLAREVMDHHPDKIFSCSLHNVSYNGFDKSLLADVDYFTMQIYGPQPNTYSWDYYEQAYNNFTSYGYPADKLLLSYGNLITDGKTAVEGYKDLFEKYGFDGPNYRSDLNEWNCNGSVKKFNGTDLVRRKQQFVIDHDLRGTMYFDMGNDLRVSDERSLIRAQNEEIAANVDTVVTSVDMPAAPSGISAATSGRSWQIDVAGGSLTVAAAATTSAPTLCTVTAADGRTVARTTLGPGRTTLATALPAGTYVVSLTGEDGMHTQKVAVPAR